MFIQYLSEKYIQYFIIYYNFDIEFEFNKSDIKKFIKLIKNKKYLHEEFFKVVNQYNNKYNLFKLKIQFL